MSRVLKTLMLWLLVLAIPTQGIAAAASASCGPSHHASGVTLRVGELVERDAAAASQRHFSGQLDSIIHDVDSDPEAEQSLHDDHAKCAACNTCCLGALLPPPDTRWNPAPAGSGFAVAFDSVPSVYTPPGPERTPRSHHA